jgi:putative PIN family toxin of toxin-antitoxin system
MEENKVVLDTHVWVSIFHKHREEDLIDAIAAKRLLLISCDEQLKELQTIATTKEQVMKMLPAKPEDYLKFMTGVAEIRHSQKRFSLLLDYKDNYLVDLAWQSKSILVSDDASFAPLKKMTRPKVEVVSKTDFYKWLGW